MRLIIKQGSAKDCDTLMKTHHEHTAREERGVVMLFTILGVGALALGATLTVALGILGEFSKRRNTVSGDQVFYTGEAAVSEGAYRFLTASSYLATAGQTLNNTATSSIVVEPLVWPYVRARGKAANEKTNRAVSRIITSFPEGFAFDYAVYAQNDLTFGGNIDVNGNVFANDGIDFNGNSAEINGDAFSPESIEDTDNISGTMVTGVDPIPPPTINPEEYRLAAQAIDPETGTSTLFFDVNDASAYLNGENRDAVVFVDDTAQTKIQGNSTNLVGSLVTMGDLGITGGTYSATGSYAAFVVYGNLKIAGGTTINGIVYATGSTSFGGGNNVINGSLISAGGASVTDLTGTATINFDPVIAANWQNITGLDTSTTSSPEIILWEES